MNKKRLRMFAGPNGSGKSTLKLLIEEKISNARLFGTYVNPDEIEAKVRSTGRLNFGDYGLSPLKEEVLDFFIRSPFLEQVQLSTCAQQLDYCNGQLMFDQVTMNSYFASVASDTGHFGGDWDIRLYNPLSSSPNSSTCKSYCQL